MIAPVRFCCNVMEPADPFPSIVIDARPFESAVTPTTERPEHPTAPQSNDALRQRIEIVLHIG
jgi:hypothetical protein